METGDVREAALEVWSAFRSRDPELIRDVLCEDVEWQAPADNATAIAMGGIHHMKGRERIVKFVTKEVPAIFSGGYNSVFTGICCEGSTVVFQQSLSAILFDGRPYENEYCFVFEMEGKRLKRVREYMDTHRGYEMIFGSSPPGQLVQSIGG